MEKKVTPPSSPFDFAILGAGVSGLILAKSLSNQGARVVVMEKSRGVGGRVSTRRFETPTQETFAFNHGIQEIKFSSPNTLPILSQYLDKNTFKSWTPLTEPTLFRPEPSLNAFPKKLAETVAVQKQTKINSIDWSSKGRNWILHSEKDQLFNAKTLVSTIPIPQLFEIISNSTIQLKDHLEQPEYEKVIALMLVLNQPRASLDEVFPIRRPFPELEWISASPENKTSLKHGYTLISSSSWAEQNFEKPDGWIFENLVPMAMPILGAEIATYQVHRWRYAVPKSLLSNESFLKLQMTCHQSESSCHLWVCGDTFGGKTTPPIERSILGAHFLAHNLNSSNGTTHD